MQEAISTSSFRHCFLFAACSLLLSTPLLGEAFRTTPPDSFTLNPRDIALHHPVTASNVTAQLYFDQGLTFIYAFNHEAAYWSFLKAAEADPQMPMAYWGMALTLGSNINMDAPASRVKEAYQLVQKAQALSTSLTKNEESYLQALAKRYSANPDADSKQLAADYSLAMKQLVAQFPDDLDAATLFAESLLNLHPWHQWSQTGEPLEGTLEAVQTLESVLKRQPHHLGANHYYIHAIEASPHPERALMSAQRLETSLRTSGHIVHMASHIYLLVGDYHKAAECNENAAIQDRLYIQAYGTEGIYPVHYLSHNLYFLSRAYSMEGRFADAKRAADELQALYLPHAHSMPELEYYLSASPFVLLRFHQWESVLSLPEPSLPLTHALWRFSRARALAGIGNLSQAKEELRLFESEKTRLPASLEFGYNLAAQVLAIAQLVAESAIQRQELNLSLAITSLERAVELQDALHYNEPPDWFFPLRESLGKLLFEEGRFADAERIFRQDLALHPRNGRALFGLKESLKAQGKRDDYQWVNREFEQAWMYSDRPLRMDDL